MPAPKQKKTKPPMPAPKRNYVINLDEIPEPRLVVPAKDHPDKLRALKLLFPKEDAPILKAVGYARLPGRMEYAAFKLKIQGDKVIDVEAEIPNMKGIAEEEAKLMFVHELMDQEHE